MSLRPRLRAALRRTAPLLLATAPALAAEPVRIDAARYAAPEEPEILGIGPEDLTRWNVVIGAGPMIAPVYEGSADFQVTPLPLVSASFGEQVTVDPRGLSLTLVNDGALSFRLRAGYDLGRDEDASDRLTGLGDIAPGAVLGGTLAYRIGPVELRSSVGHIFGGSDGTIGDIGAEIGGRYGPVLLATGASAIWGDSKYMSANFGITPAQSARSGLPAYAISTGFRRVEADASATYLASEHWALRARITLGTLIGDAADSPVVEDKLQPSAMLTLGYRF